MCAEKAVVPRLEIRLLGELEVLADGVKLALPQSRKTRALLGYLLLTGHEHRRDRLCSLLWDVADGPRAALRWSLSKLRELVDVPALKRLVSDREHVSLNTAGVYMDTLELPRLLGPNLQSAPAHALATARGLFRGELLEGIDLADFHGFSAWLLAERSRFREQHRRVLTTLIEHSGGHPERVLPLIRELVQIDPTDEAARAKLLEVLHATGAIGEAHEQARANQRLLATGKPVPAALAQPSERAAAALDPASSSETQALIGRDSELAALRAWLDDPDAPLKAWLIQGEAGMGKSRLLREHERLAERMGARCVRVRVPDARPGWPYAALQALLAQLEQGSKGPLEQLVEASVPTPQPNSSLAPPTAAGSHEQLLQAVQAVIERAVHAHAPLVLLLDDVHHLDDASIELLHHCALNLRAQRIGFVLSARNSELHDRPSVARTLRALRREHVLEELSLAALTLEQTTRCAATATSACSAWWRSSSCRSCSTTRAPICAATTSVRVPC
jgi:DNA-binding SARP family transcriptional activator